MDNPTFTNLLQTRVSNVVYEEVRTYADTNKVSISAALRDLIDAGLEYRRDYITITEG